MAETKEPQKAVWIAASGRLHQTGGYKGHIPAINHWALKVGPYHV